MKICDSHSDFLTSFVCFKEKEKYVKEIKKNGIKHISCAVFTTDKNYNFVDIENFVKEIELLKNKHKIDLLFSVEDIGFINNFKELNNIIDLKPFSVTLTWNFKNNIAGGSFSDFGLTRFGNDIVLELEKNNILVDTAHMSKKSFCDFCKITQKPIFNSHSNIHSFKKHKRNLTDRQIEQIVKSNGFLGLTFYNKFLSNDDITCKDIARQFDYLIKKFGYKNFGLGTDLFGVETENLPKDFKGYGDIKNLVSEFKKLGYNKKIITAILWKNFEDFLIRINHYK